ncbi:hypothetical protein [Chryseobacterium herbae]|uniref:Peptidase M43 pregnancy-associated plasma-A domain-containing protein n=1 Tax=Chryseobacterium herbae TaxID=2976476 RepID=A0ABT2IS02_9FLAO|nr:hypothetical protein [Chryseobacterium sp. pc1-10]MCT2561115.1 hypothetical protein [Chryseobacterium sp. pc1-10]
MSRTRIVQGKIYEIVEEHLSYYSEAGIVESASASYIENSDTKIIYAGNPDNAPSADIVNYYIKVRIKDPANYKGEFGFDWIDVDPASEEINKIQDVDFSNVEYFYRKALVTSDLGDVIAKITDEPGAKKIIKESYRFNEFPLPCTNGRIDTPFVLIKPDPTKEISLSLEVNIGSGSLVDEKIYLEGDEFYSFELVGGVKTGNRTEKQISSNKEVVELKIKCLKESPEKKYKIQQENPTKKLITVGGFIMMENKVLKLKFRVIALVSADGAPSAKAQALFQKFKDSNVKEYLNENSLNQAGFEVELENQAMFDGLGTVDLDDYFYAFDKVDWTNKKYFGNVVKQKYDVIPGTNTCKPGSIDASGNCKKVPVSTDVIVDNQKDLGLVDKANEMDEVTITEYKNKLKGKSKTYAGGLIILSDFESSDNNTGAYSRTNPLNHYSLIVYSTNTGSKDTYAHEIGHMLGLPHLFFDTKEKASYKIARENILGNGQAEKNPDGSKNENCILPIETWIRKSRTDSNTTYSPSQATAKKSTIISRIRNSNTYFQSKVTEITTLKTNIETKYREQPGSVIVAGKGANAQTKDQYLSICRNEISKNTAYINENRKVVQELNTILSDKIQVHKYKMNLKGTDYTVILQETKSYYYSVIHQIHSNYLMFIKGTTKNILDYDNTRIVYLHNQIKTMRDDLQNY